MIVYKEHDNSFVGEGESKPGKLRGVKQMFTIRESGQGSATRRFEFCSSEFDVHCHIKQWQCTLSRVTSSVTICHHCVVVDADDANVESRILARQLGL